MSDKFKFAMYWAGSCGGCEIALLEIKEKIVEVDATYDAVSTICIPANAAAARSAPRNGPTIGIQAYDQSPSPFPGIGSKE